MYSSSSSSNCPPENIETIWYQTLHNSFYHIYFLIMHQKYTNLLDLFHVCVCETITIQWTKLDYTPVYILERDGCCRKTFVLSWWGGNLCVYRSKSIPFTTKHVPQCCCCLILVETFCVLSNASGSRMEELSFTLLFFFKPCTSLCKSKILRYRFKTSENVLCTCKNGNCRGGEIHTEKNKQH